MEQQQQQLRNRCVPSLHHRALDAEEVETVRPACTAVLGNSSILTTASWPLTCTSCPPWSSAASRTTRLPRPHQVFLQNRPETRHQAASRPWPLERSCQKELL
uniref:Uncharacterized protein n=1 Tax=Mus spicilegus TaxID=10103 RepID=A0A8C6ICR1_MUSSI